MAAATLTVYPEAASVHEGRLAIGGCDVLELAREFGTPAYIVAEDDLRARARDFLRAMAEHHGERGAVAFASKAFPCTEVLRIFREEGLVVDVASAGELHLAPQGGLRAEGDRLPRQREVRGRAARRSRSSASMCVIDNLDEIDRLGRHATEGPARDAARRARGRDGHAPRRRDRARRPEVRAHARRGARGDRPARAPRTGPTCRGSTCTSGPSSSTSTRTARRSRRSPGSAPSTHYDLGGGLAVPYTAEHRTPSIDEWVAGVAGAAHDLLDAREKTLVIEPGRALVANAGVTIYTVESVKRRESTWVAVDGGMSDNLRPMLYGSPYMADVADRLGSEAEPGERCHLAGKHCESGDVIAWGVHLRDPRPGDVVVTPATGAYGHALANNYNGVPRPPVILCAGGDARVVVRRETLEDLVARDV